MTRPNTWSDKLDLGNVHQVAEYLRGLLEGNVYALVVSHPRYYFSPPTVSTDHVLREINGIVANVDDKQVEVVVRDHNGSWAFHSPVDVPEDAPEFTRTNVLFRGDTVSFTSRAPNGDIIHWTFIVQAPVQEAVAAE